MTDKRVRLCFIVCDGGPAGHFAEFTKYLISDNRLSIDIYTNEIHQAKFEDLRNHERIRMFHFSLHGMNESDEDNLATKIIENCMKENVDKILIDIGNQFDVKLARKLTNTIDFWCYYDNPEEYVPGGYSNRCIEMMSLCQNILFANKNLARLELDEKIIRGIGYYPIEIAEKLKQRRELERTQLRDKYGWKNIEYIFIYFGGNNQLYYELAFPHFLSLLSQIDQQSLHNTLFLFHQHPAAKKDNYDGNLFQNWLEKNSHIQASLSQLTSDEAQILADGIFYYQTSMAYQFALIGIPIMQVAHKIYKDILVQHNLCHTAIDLNQFENGLKLFKKQNNSMENKQLIYDAIGYNKNWLKNFREIVLHFE